MTATKPAQIIRRVPFGGRMFTVARWADDEVRAIGAAEGCAEGIRAVFICTVKRSATDRFARSTNIAWRWTM